MQNKLFWEENLWSRGLKSIAGLDEAGRGSWAGPVVAAVVVFKPYQSFPQIDDSKKLTPEKRAELFDFICEHADGFAIEKVESDVIDKINILQASLLAMKNAVDQLTQKPEHLLIDGKQTLNVLIPQNAIVDGDNLSQSIAAASILAKVARDRLMIQISEIYPQYGFEKHKGYGTKQHQQALEKFGILDCHRKSYRPIKEIQNGFG